MKLGPRLALALLLAGIGPVALMGFLASSANSAELERTAREHQAQRAEELATEIRRDLDRTVDALQLSAGFLPASDLTPAELEEALALPLHQVRGVEVLVALDEHGANLTAPVHSGRGLEGAELRRFAEAIPWRQALTTGAAVGPPFVQRGVPHVAVAVRLGPRAVVAADVALVDAAGRLGPGGPGREAVLTDASGTPLTAATPSLTARLPALLSGCPPGCAPWSGSHLEGDGVLAGVARVADFDWAVVITQPLAAVLAPAARVRRYTIYWTVAGVVLALALAAVLVRDILRPVRKLSESAQRLSAGRFDVELETRGGDELAELARAFSQMVREVQRRDAEIRGWNGQLEARVEAARVELQGAQEQVNRARHLTALASLSAGFAHELNNPLTAILGLSSLLRSEARTVDERESLDHVISQTRRMAQILGRLVSLTDGASGGVLRVPLAELIAASLARHGPALAARGVSTNLQLPETPPECAGNPIQLQSVLDALIENAAQAMPEGGSLGVSLATVGGGAVRLSVTDEGVGMSAAVRERIFDPFFTTKPTGTQVGLGLTVAHRIVQNHHGSIVVTSEEGRGSTFTVTLPAAPAPAHLH